MKSPNPTEPMQIGTLGPISFEMLEQFWRIEFVPIVIDIQKFAAMGTGMMNFFDTELFAAIRINAMLKNCHKINFTTVLTGSF